MWYRLKQSFIRFMYGRYGMDNLYRFLFWLYLGLIVANIFLQSALISLSAMAVLIYMMFRAFSRNISARQAENRKFLGWQKKITGFFDLQKNRWKDRKTHVYRKCPHCKATLRLPRQPGEHTVRCPKCRQTFDLKI